jgi:hypothetical protein
MKINSLLFFFFFSFSVFAQVKVNEKPPVDLYLQVSGSMNAYKGDLSAAYQKWSSAFHIGVFSNRNRWVNPTASLSLGNLTGQKTDGNYLAPPPRPNTFFKTNFVQFSLGMRLNVIKSNFLTIYLNPNIGILRFTPRDIRNQKLADQAETRALGETLPTTALTFPVSLGVMYRFKASDVGMGFEIGLLNPMTNYLDNIGEYGSGKNDNSMQVKLSVYAPLTRVDEEAERKKQAERAARRAKWLKSKGLLKEEIQKDTQETKKVKTEEKKLTPAQRKRQKAKEKATREKAKNAAKKAKVLEKKKKEMEQKKKKAQEAKDKKAKEK